MGDDGACQTNVIGTVRIKMFNGVVKDLIDVRYVFQINKNIISVGTVESKGLKVTLENGVPKVTKGFIVVMKRDKNLYYLKDSTTTGALVAVDDSDEDATRLWHMIGHAGEKSMQLLAR